MKESQLKWEMFLVILLIIVNEIPITKYIIELNRIGLILLKKGFATVDMDPYKTADKMRRP